MPSLGTRIVAYGFVGAFAVGSLVLLAIAIGSTAQRAALIFSGSRADGTVVAARQVGRMKSGAAVYAPVLQFNTRDGRTYVVTSDVSGPESAYRIGQHLRVLYEPDHPDGARVDAFAPLWTLPLVTGVVGAAFSIVPAFVVATWRRRRRAERGEALPDEAYGTIGRGPRRVIAIVLTGGGLLLVGLGLGHPNSAWDAAVEGRVLGISVGVLLVTSGVLIGQWVATGSRIYHALGGLLMTSLAVTFGWVAFFGQASGFTVGSAAAVTANGGVTVARIAFGIAAGLTGFASLWSWNQVLRRYE
jgi:uncharacterized protein DUF3592